MENALLFAFLVQFLSHVLILHMPFFTTYLYWNSKAALNFKEINNQFRDLFNWLTPQADLPAQLGVSLLMRTQHALYGQLDVGRPPVSLHPTVI